MTGDRSKVLDILLEQQKAMSALLMAQGAAITRIETNLNRAMEDIKEAKGERSTIKDKLYTFGTQAALIAYVVFDQRSRLN